MSLIETYVPAVHQPTWMTHPLQQTMVMTPGFQACANRKGIRTSDTNERPREKSQAVGQRFDRRPLPGLEAIDAAERTPVEAMVGIVQPKSAGDTVGVPACEKTGGYGDQVCKDGNAHGQHKGGAVGQDDEDDPRAPTEGGVFV